MTYVASVLWTLATGASAYIGTAVRGTLVTATHGLAELGNQTVRTLSAVATAMISAMRSLVASAFSATLGDIKRAMNDYTAALWSDWNVLWSEYNSTGTFTRSSAAAFLNETFGEPFIVALGVMGAIAVALVIIELLSVGSEFIVSTLIGLLVGSIGGAIISLGTTIPTALLSPASVDVSYSAYNNSTPERSPSGAKENPTPDLTGDFPLLAKIVDIGLSGYQLWDDAPKAVDLVEAVTEGYAPVTAVTIVPVGSAALGMLGLAVGVDGYLIGGFEGALLDHIGAVVGVASLLYSLSNLALFYVPLSEAQQLDEAYVGLGLDAASAVLGFCSIA